MQSLISGAECATPSNPLSQVLKHTEGDRSLQRDRVAGPSSFTLRQLPPTAAGPGNAADLSMARDFFDSGPSASIALTGPTFGIPRESLQVLQQEQGSVGLPVSNSKPSQWAQAMNMALTSASTNSEWANEFSFSPGVNAGLAQSHEFRPPMPYTMGEYVPTNRTYFQSTISSQLQQPGVNWDQEFSRVEGKGKGKATDAEFDAAFARVAASLTSANEDSKIFELQDNSEPLEEALEGMKITDNPEKHGTEDEPEYLSDFQKVWDRLRNTDLPPPEADIAKWEAEFNQVMQAQREELDFGEDFQNAWQKNPGEFDETEPVEPVKFDEDGIPQLDPYKFEPNNPYLTEQHHSHLARAKLLLEQNGSLTEAALLLEAAIRQGELGEGGYEAWILLGETRSMDEREDAGMKALAEGVRRAVEAGNAGEGMISLAISYTNESYDRASHSILHRWLNARFPSLVPNEFKGPLPSSSWASHERAIDAFLAVARQQHIQNHVDPDVQTGLGVLFYNDSEYEKAKDCFGSALAARPNDYLLWNRLGSCLSNGSKPEEALGVYREALRLRPTYTRAIYNVGVACLNIGAYKEAAEHFLSALLLQESTGDKSEQLWQTLRKCFLSMERPDLADRAKPGESLEIFKQEGFDF